MVGTECIQTSIANHACIVNPVSFSIYDGGAHPVINPELPPCEICTNCSIESPDLALSLVACQRKEIVEEGLPQWQHLA